MEKLNVAYEIKMEKLNIADNEALLVEIERLRNSPYVKLAKKMENQALKQRLYQLRSLDKKGRKIAETLGIEVE